jgi:hypothetical protein
LFTVSLFTFHTLVYFINQGVIYRIIGKIIAMKPQAEIIDKLEVLTVTPITLEKLMDDFHFLLLVDLKNICF